jgi:serine/threonine protein kinase
MATGSLPFQGQSSGAIFDAILHKTPVPLARFSPNLPHEFEQLLSKCLEKDRELRCQTAAELRADLKRLKRDISSGKAPALRPSAPQGIAANATSASVNECEPAASVLPGLTEGPAFDRTVSTTSQPKKSRIWLIATVVSLFVIMASAAVFSWNNLFRHGLAAKAFQNPRISGLTSTGDVNLARISPDGRYLAYISKKNGKFSLWVRQVSVDNPVKIIEPGTEHIFDVTFTPVTISTMW